MASTNNARLSLECCACAAVAGNAQHVGEQSVWLRCLALGGRLPDTMGQLALTAYSIFCMEHEQNSSQKGADKL
eukprot:6190455-Pleurochrysis_carterae.AAC.1